MVGVVDELRDFAFSFSEFLNNLKSGNVTHTGYSEILNLLRTLRFRCLEVFYQNGIREYENYSIITNVLNILIFLISAPTDNDEAQRCITVGLQFLGNMVVGNKENQKLVMLKFADFLKEIFLSTNSKNRNIICMIYYNIYIHFSDFEDNLVNNAPCMTYICENFTNPEYEYGLLLLERLLHRGRDFRSFYSSLPDESRVKVLNFINIKAENEDIALPTQIIATFMVEKVTDFNVDYIIDSVYSGDTISSWELSIMFSILSLLSDKSEVRHLLLQNEFCSYITELFVKIHRYEKEYSDFDVHNLAAAENAGDITKCPSYLFKTNVTKIIANLSWDNKSFKQTYEHLIQPLSECCRIDEKNPLIGEWAVFAIRNIREVRPR